MQTGPFGIAVSEIDSAEIIPSHIPSHLLRMYALPILKCDSFFTQRKHLATYIELQEKKQTTSSHSSISPTSVQLKLTDIATCSTKFERNHPRQKAVTDAIVKMIVKDIQPVYTVERKGFRELLAMLEPRYTMVSRQCLQQSLLPSYFTKVEEAIGHALEGIGTCSITLDIWSSRRMHSYLGVTCHFVSETWEVKSLLIACSQLHGRHTGENIVSEFEEIITRHKLSDKLYKVVTDNASNVKKAFADTVSVPSFEVEVESEESEQEDEDSEETDDSDDEVEVIELEKINIPQRVSCFAHTLQLSIKDGL